MLAERIESDFKNALKQQNSLALGTLRMLKAAVKNKEIEKKVQQLEEKDLLDVVQKQIKQRRDSIAEFEKANRQDLVKKEKEEMTVLEHYLPAQLTESELKSLIQKTVQNTGAKTKADIGKVMKELMPQIAGRADGKQVNQILLTFLS